MVLKKIKPEQGDIWLFDPDPTKGTEIGKKVRPALIISNNELNDGYSGIIVIVPLTSKERKIISHVKIEPPEGGLTTISYAVCEKIRSISKERLIKKLGVVKNRSILLQVHHWITDLIWL